MMVWGQGRWSQIQVIISNPLSLNTYVVVLVTEAVCVRDADNSLPIRLSCGERASIPVS